VKIRLIGDRESVYAVASRLTPRLKWKEYPLYEDKERTQVDKHRVTLYATVIDRQPTKSKNMTLDSYIPTDSYVETHA